MTTTEELAVSDSKTLFAICDDATAYHETLDYLDAQLAEAKTDEDRDLFTKQRAEVLACLDSLGKQLSSKADDCAAVLRRMRFEREFIISAERDRLKLKEKASERAEEWLRSYILSTMERNGLKQLKTPTNTFFTRGSEAVEITDVTVIPPEYFNVDVKLPLPLWRSILGHYVEFVDGDLVDGLNVKATPSLSTIKKAIKQGVDVPGADIKLNSNLVLR